MFDHDHPPAPRALALWLALFVVVCALAYALWGGAWLVRAIGDSISIGREG